MKEKIIIKSVNDLIKPLFYSGNVEKGLQYCFRGQTNHSWKVLPTLLRKSRYEAMIFERAIFKRFLLNSKGLPYVMNNDPIEYLMVLQHFEIPTKLLDLTLDPLVALFFACYDPNKKNLNKDGKILIYPKYQYDKLTISQQTLDIYNKPITEENFNDRFWKRVKPQTHLYFEPLFKNARMRAQNGCFIYFSSLPINQENLNFVSLEEYHGGRNRHINELNKTGEIKYDKLWYGHILVAKEFKSNILHELDMKYGISPKTMFVENEYLNKCKSFYKSLYKEALITCDELKTKIPKEKENELL